jgi:hypothetical protein
MRHSEYIAYFEEVAKSNKLLNHLATPDRKTFRSMHIDEILNDANTDLIEISLICEHYNIRTRDLLSDNPSKIITGAYLVIKQYEKGNTSSYDEILDETLIVADQILAKIKNDNKKFIQDKSHPWKLKGFDQNSARHSPVSNLFDFWGGWRVQFEIELSHLNNLVLKDEDWNNDTRFSI